jgi:capsular polysaccharide transport system permease protein
MNMHGIIEPIGTAQRQVALPAWRRIVNWFWRKRTFTFVVVVPTLLLACYLYVIASDQYESEAHFLVRSTDSAAMPTIGISQALSSVTGIGATQSEAMSVADYLTSHDAVATLRRQDRLVGRFHRSDADIFSRLLTDNPTPERLLSYYQKHVMVEYNTETGITTLRVHTFRPEDSYALVGRLLQLGEARVNDLNERSYKDSIALANRQLVEAEAALAVNQTRMTAYRHTKRDIDPEASGKAQLGLVTDLSGQLAAARAQLSAMGSLISPSSPQYHALQERILAMAAQVSQQSGRLTGGDGAIANDIAGYEDLKFRQEFLAKRYEAAAASVEHAREQALKQQLYVVRVVEPNMPVKALFPQRGRILLTVLVGLLLTYSIGWLIAAGVREHAA